MKKRIFIFTLAAAILIGALAGCGNNAAEQNPSGTNPGSESNSANGETTAPQYAYQAEYLTIEVDEAYQMDYINQFCISGNDLFFCGQCITGTEPYVDEITGETVIDEETGEPIETDIYEAALFRMDLTTRETVRLEGYQSIEVPEGQQGNSYITNMLAGADGTILMIEQMSTYSFDLPENFDSSSDDPWKYYTPGESGLYLRQFDAEGQQLKSVQMSLGEDVYPQQVLMDQEGNIYINTYDSIYILDSEGTIQAELTNDNWAELNQIGDQVGIVTYDETAGGRVFRAIDPATKEYGETVELPDNASRLYTGMEDYAFLFDSYGDTVYGYNQETEESEKLFSWLDCDVSSDYLESITVLDDGRIAALSRDYSGESPKYEVIFLQQVDASTLPQKQTLTLACMWLSQNVRNAVLDFNKTHDDIRIEVRDYSEYNTDDDYTAGQTKLNTEILSGKVPDILCTDNLPVSQYAGKGVLMDLWPLIDGDGELSRDDLMTHFFDVLSVDDKLYQVTSSFNIQTAVGNANIVGDRTSWTLDDLLDALDSLEDGTTIFGEGDIKSNILSSCVSRNIDSFVDWENASCNFDSQEFIDLLSFANTFPAEFDWENYDWETEEGTHSRLMNGRQLLLDAYISDFGYLQMMNAMFDGNASFIGYPSTAGNGSTFGTDGGISISATCQNVDAAWSFVRTFLMEDHQTSYYIWGFPTNRHAFEAMVEEQMTPEYYTDPETGEQVEQSKGGWGWDDIQIEIMAMTQEEYDTFMRLYEACNSVYTYNEEVFNIIQQEVEPFFAGQKTAEETAKLVQDRVSLYVMEQG